MNRIPHFVRVSLLAAAAAMLSPATMPAPLAASQSTAVEAAASAVHSPAALTALLASSLALRVAIDNNHAAAAGVPCADLGADGAACATGHYVLTNQGKEAIWAGGWKLYVHSIRRLLRLDNPSFTLQHLTGDLYSITPLPGKLYLAPGQSVTLPFVAEYWYLRYSDLLPRPFVAVAGAEPAILQFDDTDDETRYVVSLPADAQNTSTGNAPPVAAQPVSYRALPSVKREHPLDGSLDLHGVQLGLAGLSMGQIDALRDRAQTLGLDDSRTPVVGAVAPRRLPADIAVSGGYRLTISPRGALIEGDDPAGVYYGVQTLFSLVPEGGGRIPAMQIEDAPRFPYRGMHVDLARNFKHPPTLRRLIDQMSAYKLNRLHIHVSDDEGWRIEIPGLPELTEVGGRRCFDPSEMHCLLPQLASGPENQSGGGYLTRDQS